MKRPCDTCKFRQKTLPFAREFDMCSSPKVKYTFCDTMSKEDYIVLPGDCNGGRFYEKDDRKWYEFWKKWKLIL